MQIAHQPQRSSPTSLTIAVLLVVAGGILLRFANLDNKPLWWDETLALTWSAGYTRSEVDAGLRSAPHVKAPDQILRLQRAGPEKGVDDLMRPLLQEAIHPPIFYVLLHLWELYVGDSMRLVRALPALLSLLVLPAAWWLCRELFGSTRVAWLSVSLLSLSPLHVAYAQEVKQYSLWTAMILATSAALLRALEGGSRRAWLCFSLAAIVSLYTHPLTALLLIGFGGYVLYRERFRFSATAKNFVIFSGLAGLAFAPWLLALTGPRPTVVRLQNWTGENVSTAQLFARWGENLSRMVFDLSNLPARLTEGAADEIGIAALALLCAYAVFVLARQHDRRPLWFVLALVLPGAATLAGWDALQGGIRSTVARFLIPSYLGMQIAIAHLLSEKLQGRSSGWIRRPWVLVLVGLWGLGAISCWANSQSNELWSKPQSGSIHRAGEVINARPGALVLYWGIPVLGLAWELDPEVRLMDARRWWWEARTGAPRSSGEVYVYALPKQFWGRFSPQHHLTPVTGGEGRLPDAGAILYRLTKKSKAP